MHLNSNLTIPPRRWYTLAQAADKLTHDTGQKITVNDMVHFLFLGYFLPFVHVKYKLNHSIIFNSKYHIDFKHSKAKLAEATNATLQLSYDDLLALNDYCKLALLNVEYPQNLTTKWLKEYFDNFITECGIHSENELNDDVLDRFFAKNKIFTYCIDGLLGVKIETLYNGDASIFEELEIIEQGLKIHHTDLLTPPLFDHPKAHTMYHLKLEEPFYIPADELIIAYEGLVRIADDIRVNLSLIAEKMDDMGHLDKSIAPYLHKGKPQFSLTLQPPKTEKTIKTVKNKSNEKSENRTPRNKKDFFTPLILASIHATAQAYPHLGGYQIVNAVLDTLKDKQGFKTSDLYTVEGYLGKYKRAYNATFPRNSGRHKAQITAIITEPAN